MRPGCRVVRGPNWKWEDQDGGEGHVGTVVDLPATAPRTCMVQWDAKPMLNYRAGLNDRYDLRIFDSAPSGVKHDLVCTGCSDRVICGMLWTCVDCPSVNLCTFCYMTDKHTTSHSFQRINEAGSLPVAVPPRQFSRKFESWGIFTGAVVKRGRDWTWDDQDGDGVGTVLALQGWCEESSRSVVNVEWASRTTNVYRLGHRGKTDLHSVKPAKGWPYYVDHLPNFGEEFSGGRPSIFSVGEHVRVDSNLATVKKLANGHGQWHDNMREYVGAFGTVHRITESDDVRIIFVDRNKWTYNPKAVTKVFHQNDKVEMTQDLETLREYHVDQIGTLSKLRGIRGRITGVRLDTPLYFVQFADGSAHHVHANCLYAVTGGSAGISNVLAASDDASSTSSAAPAAASLTTAVAAIPMEVPVEPSLGLQSRLHNFPATAVVLEPAAMPMEVAVEPSLGLQSRLHNFTMAPVVSELVVQQFRQALTEGRLELMQTILYACPSLVDYVIDNEKALIKAVCMGKIEIVRLFADCHVDVNVKDKNGDSVMHIAIRRSLRNMFQLFCEPYWLSLINSVNADHDTPLHLAIKLGKFDFADTLIGLPDIHLALKNNEGNMPLHLAVAEDKDDIFVRLLSCSKTNLLLLNDDGQNPMHIACIKGKTRLIERILSVKPELVNSANKKGFAPLHLAVFHDQLECVSCILSQEFIHCNFRVMRNREFNSFTAMHLAVYRQFPRIVEALAEKGAAIELSLTEDRNQMTPLHLAVDALIRCRPGSIEQLTAQALFDLQQVDAQQLCMDLLMERSGQCASLAICCYLLAKGGDCSLKNVHGFTPFDLVANEPRIKHLLPILNAFAYIYYQQKPKRLAQCPPSRCKPSSTGVLAGMARCPAASSVPPPSTGVLAGMARCPAASSVPPPPTGVLAGMGASTSRSDAAASTRTAPPSKMTAETAAGNLSGAGRASNMAAAAMDLENMGDACRWCSEQQANVRFEPCNHVLFCTRCFAQIGGFDLAQCIQCQMAIKTKIGPGGEIRAKPKSEISSTDVLCPICMENVKNIAPRCGHTLCRACAKNVSECPMCRGPMVDLRPVYL